MKILFPLSMINDTGRTLRSRRREEADWFRNSSRLLTSAATRFTFLLGLCTILLLGSTSPAPATLSTNVFNSGFQNGGLVPDANPSGIFDTRTLSGLGTSIVDVNVRLNLTGGFNGDLFVYLTHSTGTAYLLNRVGRETTNSFGYSEAGLNIRLDDAAANDIHLYRNIFNYQTLIANGSNWLPDGRSANPTNVVSGDPRDRLLNQFNGLDPNGNWTLFVSDLSSGDESTLSSWELEIDAIPEPVNVALGIFGGLFVLVQIVRHPRLRQWRQARV